MSIQTLARIGGDRMYLELQLGSQPELQLERQTELQLGSQPELQLGTLNPEVHLMFRASAGEHQIVRFDLGSTYFLEVFW